MFKAYENDVFALRMMVAGFLALLRSALAGGEDAMQLLTETMGNLTLLRSEVPPGFWCMLPNLIQGIATTYCFSAGMKFLERALESASAKPTKSTHLVDYIHRFGNTFLIPFRISASMALLALCLVTIGEPDLVSLGSMSYLFAKTPMAESEAAGAGFAIAVGIIGVVCLIIFHIVLPCKYIDPKYQTRDAEKAQDYMLHQESNTTPEPK